MIYKINFFIFFKKTSELKNDYKFYFYSFKLYK